ncbi:replication regulatory protein RepA [Pantoea piersonii]|uniref:replication regulatory protein RepA n=1 Tax=Pantoea piersonii TaxID=2364647 RepID=UPI0022F19F49|nr:replication regulatory protein RepA [Pantoea piersonii]WBV24270.1 replication regulatory protein RepA [Pantoea piersonii]
MSPRDSVTSAPEKKRTRSRQNPTPDNERAKAYQARKRETHKEIKVFIRTEVKQALIKLCEADGLTQAEVLERLIENETLRINKS